MVFSIWIARGAKGDTPFGIPDGDLCDDQICDGSEERSHSVIGVPQPVAHERQHRRSCPRVDRTIVDEPAETRARVSRGQRDYRALLKHRPAEQHRPWAMPVEPGVGVFNVFAGQRQPHALRRKDKL